MTQDNNTLQTSEKLNLVNYKTENIKDLIYTIREKQVMLDSDVAKLYHCETKYINCVVKRNTERFPEKFCFQLTQNKFENLRCQIVTASNSENEKYRNKKIFAICIYRARNCYAFCIVKK